MSRSEKLILVRDLPQSIVAALDQILASQGLARVAAESISEDFSPLLHEEGGPLAFVLSAPRGDWVACFSSLDPEAESRLAEHLSAGLDQPVIYALLDGVAGAYLYRRWQSGQLHEEIVSDTGVELDEPRLLQRLEEQGLDSALIDDRIVGFGGEHLVVGYTAVA